MILRIFKRRGIQKQYLESWITFLKEIDLEYKQLYESQDEIGLRGDSKVYDEIFPQEFVFGEVKLYIQFRINKIVDLLADMRHRQIITRDFGYRKKYHFTKTDGTLYELKTAPSIIIAEIFVDPTIEGYVIDGNHRLTSAIANNYDIVQYKFIDEKTLSLNKQAFATKWDYVFYLFVNEIGLLYNDIQRNNTSIEDALKYSYLSDEKYTYKLSNHNYLAK